MGLVYALTLEVRSDDGSNPHPLLVKHAQDWITSWYEARGESAPWSSAASHSTTVVTSPAEDHQLDTLQWSHPDERDTTLRWDTRIEIATADYGAEFTIQVGLESTEFILKPIRYGLGTPRIVRTLTEEYKCTVGGTPVLSRSAGVAAEEVQKMVGWLQANERTLPVVALSADPYLHKPIVDPNRLASRLIGLAQVLVLDRAASFGLTDLLGKDWSCFNGAVRIYYPGFTTTESIFAHPLYLPDSITRQLQRGGDFEGFLFRRLASVAAARAARGERATSISRRALDEASRLRDAERQQLLQIESKSAELELALSLGASAEREATELREEVSRLSAEILDLRQAFAVVQRAAAGEGEFEAAEGQGSPDSVLEAVQRAQARWADQLEVLPSALDSAEDSPYGQPEKVYDALEALADITQRWQKAESNGTGMGGSWKQLLADLGFDWTPQVSQTSKTRWPDEYSFTYEGARVLFEEHVTLGGGGPDTCLSIHVLRDEAKCRLIVAHVGRHLRNTSA